MASGFFWRAECSHIAVCFFVRIQLESLDEEGLKDERLKGRRNCSWMAGGRRETPSSNFSVDPRPPRSGSFVSSSQRLGVRPRLLDCMPFCPPLAPCTPLRQGRSRFQLFKFKPPSSPPPASLSSPRRSSSILSRTTRSLDRSKGEQGRRARCELYSTPPPPPGGRLSRERPWDVITVRCWDLEIPERVLVAAGGSSWGCVMRSELLGTTLTSQRTGRVGFGIYSPMTRPQSKRSRNRPRRSHSSLLVDIDLGALSTTDNQARRYSFSTTAVPQDSCGRPRRSLPFPLSLRDLQTPG